MAVLKDIAEQMLDTWRGLTLGHRVILVLLAIVCFGLFGAVLSWQSQPQKGVVFSGMKAEECADMADKLEEAGIPVDISSDGSALLVPESRMQEARMVGAQEGLPSRGGDGFQMFKEPKLGMTPFAEQVNYTDALQNELARTIKTLDSVSQARVHLALPDEEVFARDKEDASASVVIVRRKNREMSQKQISGISNLVASAVKSLGQGDVTVTDERGRALTGTDREATERRADSRWEYRQRIEQDLERKVENMLSKLLGTGRADVAVSADLDFKNRTERSETFDEDNRVLASENIMSEESTGGGRQVGGPVGGAADEEGEEDEGGGDGETGDNSSSENIDTEYLVGKSVSETVDRGAVISGLSVAAFVDNKQGEDGETAASMDEIKAAIADAVGFDEDRGDSMQVVPADFPEPEPEELALNGGTIPEWVWPMARYASVAIVALVCLLIARWALKGGREDRLEELEVELLPDRSGETEGKTREELAWEQVCEYVDEKPEETGRLLESWITAEE